MQCLKKQNLGIRSVQNRCKNVNSVSHSSQIKRWKWSINLEQSASLEGKRVPRMFLAKSDTLQSHESKTRGLSLFT